MMSVKAPHGFEGSVYWNDGGREYDVAVRRVGDLWWTVCYHSAGHAHLTEAERMARAEASILHTLKVRGWITEGRE